MSPNVDEMLLTLEDVDFLIHILTAVDPEYPVTKGDAVAERLKDLKKLWSKEGLPVVEVDIYLMGEVSGRAQRTKIHTFAVSDLYKLLPEDEDPEIPADGWKIQGIRAHVVEEKE